MTNIRDISELPIDGNLTDSEDNPFKPFDSAKTGFWRFNVPSNSIEFDENLLQVYGYSPDDINSSFDFCMSISHPDDLPRIFQASKEHMEGKTPSFSAEIRVFTKTGELCWILVNGQIIKRAPDGAPLELIGTFTDITERMAFQKLLFESQEKYKSIFEHLNDAYCRFDFSGKIIEINKNLCDLLGVKYNELIDSNVKLFFPNHAIKYLHRRLSRIIDNQSVNFEIEIVTPKRKALPISVSARLITSKNNGIIQALIRDVTERRQYEKAILDEKMKLNAIIEHSPNAIARFSRSFKCQYISPNFEKITGISSELCIGKKMAEFALQQSLISHIEEKMRWVLRRNKEQSISFSIDTPFGTKHFESIIVPESSSTNTVEYLLMTFMDVTERVNHERELNVSRQKLEDAQLNVHFGTSELDLITGEVKWSSEMYQIFERDPQLPAPSRDEYYYSFVHPDEYQYVWDTINSCTNNQVSANITYRIITSSGKIKHASNITRIENDQFGNPRKLYSYIVDITEKKQIEDRLFAERDMLQIIMDNVPDAVYFKDKDGHYLRANKALASLLGLKSPEQFLGKTDYDLFPKEMADTLAEAEQLIFLSGYPEINYEKEIKAPFGIVWLSTTMVGVKDQNGNVTQLVGIARDFTQYKLAEEQLRNAKEKAEQADKLKSTFLANMSHEIRTPLNGILGFANLMELREFKREKEIEYLRIINNSGKVLLNLINDIIDIAKIEAGQINIEKSDVDLHTIFSELSEFYDSEKQRRDKANLEIVPIIPEDPALRFVATDPFRLRQVISNLINNSLKFTDQGSIEFGYVSANNNLLFFVKDTGIGMSDNDTRIIFERFKQVGMSSRKKEGTGLGLAISKGLVEILGGNIWVQSQLGVGSEFFFTIPLEVIDPKRQTDTLPYFSPARVEYKWPGKTVLLVEDEDVNYVYINELLEITGINLLHVSTAEEAINICKSAFKIDLILMDMRLPGINGFDATRVIKKLRSDVPIIAQTAFAMENERKNCLDAGCDHYLTKPFDQNILFKTLNSFLSFAN
jgi:two-component system CheB/CheR fusion protein